LKKKEPDIELSKEQKKKAADKIKEYIEENFEIEIGNLQAEIFLDFITDNIGVYYYNNAIADSLVFINKKVEDLYLLMKDEEEI
jgi:uncharacterized protein (DUF2164 family)